MLIPYPDIKPYKTQMLAVDSPHQVYLEESGNPDGLPVLFVHGGPGAGCSRHDRCFFDPEKYRIILFDQRGAGQSTPHAELNANTTDDLSASFPPLHPSSCSTVIENHSVHSIGSDKQSAVYLALTLIGMLIPRLSFDDP